MFPRCSHGILGKKIAEMSEKRIIVAIDGPAGAGKSTLARRVAEKLGFVYVDTGAMYRAIALWALRLKIDSGDAQKVTALAEEAQIDLAPGGVVRLNGEDVTTEIRTAAVSAAASKVAAIAGVRRALRRIQRGIAQDSSIVMEGRDIGTVIFPKAEVKIFLDADPAERARRRAVEHGAEIAEVSRQMNDRDKRDRQRSEAPLMQAPDAQLIDTTGMSIDEVEENILRLVRAKVSNGKEVMR